MKLNRLLALLLALSLAMGLSACSLFAPEENDACLDLPLPQGEEAVLAYYDELAVLLGRSEGFTYELSYGMDDIEIGNKTLKDNASTLKDLITGYLGHKEELEKAEAACLPALPEPGDVLEAQVREVLAIRVAEKLAALEKDIEEGKNPKMATATAQEREDYAKEQLGESTVENAARRLQLDITLAPEAAQRILVPGDRADILAQLKKAEGYLFVGDYALEPTELRITAQVEKATDKTPARFIELAITEKAAVTAVAAGVGALAQEGEIPISLTLTKTVKYNTIYWEEEA